MQFTTTEIPEVIIIEPEIYRDARGFFMEFYHGRKFSEGGISAVFVQDNHSGSTRSVLRGLHFQVKRPQGKLVRAIKGKIFDVAVDIRRGSPTFKKWVGTELSDQDGKMLYVPPGFAHGFVVLSDTAEVEYKCTDFYTPGDESGIAWNDPDIGIQWPVKDPVLSDKDKRAARLEDIPHLLPAYKAK